MEVEELIEKRTSERPKKNRLLLRGAFRKHNVKCEKYGQYGHNKEIYRNCSILKLRKQSQIILPLGIGDKITSILKDLKKKKILLCSI